MAEVRDGVWVGQEPGWDSPFNLGAHCAKGSSVRELGHGERRLKYPMKLVNGTYTRVSWEQAINEIGDQMLKIREVVQTAFIGWALRRQTTNSHTSTANLLRTGARTTLTTRLESATRLR